MKSSILSKKEMEYILRNARRHKEECGSIPPALIVRTTAGEELACTMQLPKRARAKRKYMRSLLKSLKQDGHKVGEAVFVAESWTVLSKSADLEQPPSQHPDRFEAIMAVGRDAEGKTFSAVLQPFEFRNGEIEWKKIAVEMYNKPGQSLAGLVRPLDYFFEE